MYRSVINANQELKTNTDYQQITIVITTVLEARKSQLEKIATC